MPATVISIVNTKGGVGKSTVVHNLAPGLARRGYRVGMIDFDHQASLTEFTGEDLKYNSDLRTLLLKKSPLKLENFTPLDEPNLFFIPNYRDVDPSFFYEPQVGVLDKYTLLKRILKDLDFLDIILVDTPGTEGLQIYNALIASHFVLIPTQLERAALSPVYKVKDIIDDVRVELNPKLQMLGILRSMYDIRNTTTNTKSQTELEEQFPNMVMKSKISTNVSFKKVQDMSQHIYWAEDNRGVTDYNDVVTEILSRLNKPQYVKTK
jgi:chromosome partitioning protein